MLWLHQHADHPANHVSMVLPLKSKEMDHERQIRHEIGQVALVEAILNSTSGIGSDRFNPVVLSDQQVG